ncbi:GntR family transcriptional regulator [Saccharothrix sp. ST-888]|uniref:GntR family transcriptional regulator n=1 Tax=Saccharothrix sp. ST-888 TaxID=1427391 RepID=UPI0005EC4E33|nr:GntR family transcriptional regulator [Saccharothrix sp. ST-888]KJK55111.1 GntR family transcriptional regulator [Saccharothrix sp. ST-888]
MSRSDPAYLPIADALRRRINQGEWAPGERLPSRAKLAEEYGAHPFALQRAQELLIAEGLLEGRSGSGTFVRLPTVRRRLLRSRHLTLNSGMRFFAEPDQFGRTDDFESTSRLNVPAPPEIAARLGIEEGEPTVHTSYEFLVDRKPGQLAESWEPMAITAASGVQLPEFASHKHQGVVKRMAALGVVVDFAVESVRAGRAGADQALKLGICTGDLVVLIERTYFDVDGRAVETADFVIPDATWEISYELPVERP